MTAPSVWACPPEEPTLEPGVSHIWLVWRGTGGAMAHTLGPTLSADELARAERFHFQRDRDRFVATRGAVRNILGRYLRHEPSQLRFQYGPHGKPALALADGEPPIRFNVSHSDDVALCAVACGQEIGVDVEHVRSDFPGLQVARHSFSPREIAVLQGLPTERQAAAFFTLWILKEAYLKATGQGLGLDLRQVDVSPALAVPMAELRVIPDGDAHCPSGASWWLRTLPSVAGYAGALAVEGTACRLVHWQWMGG
jgi:4'-phosphopantetheinyl transferase